MIQISQNHHDYAYLHPIYENPTHVVSVQNGHKNETTCKCFTAASVSMSIKNTVSSQVVRYQCFVTGPRISSRHTKDL